MVALNYLVPNNLSPASPKPGTIYAFSFNFSSILTKYISISGWAFCTASIPYGAAIKQTNFMDVAPFSFKKSMAAVAEPPVANIGSNTIKSLSSISCGSLQ